MFVAMKRPDPLFKLRLPDAVRKPLESAAEENNRTLTSEILARLEVSLSRSATSADQEQEIRIRHMQNIIDAYERVIDSSELTIKANEKMHALLKAAFLRALHVLIEKTDLSPDERQNWQDWRNGLLHLDPESPQSSLPASTQPAAEPATPPNVRPDIPLPRPIARKPRPPKSGSDD